MVDNTNAQVAGAVVTKAAEQAKVPEPIAKAAGEEAELICSAGKKWYKSKTIWVNAGEVCTWQPTGRDIFGRPPAREIKGHSSAAFASPQDV